MSTPLFRKLNLGAQSLAHVLEAPASFEPELAALQGVQVQRALPKAGSAGFVLSFVATRAALATWIPRVVQAAPDDAVVWFAYPKGTSKRYRCDFDRDHGWVTLIAAGFETVRMVAIDEDWSALRWRRSEFVGRPRPAARE